MSGDRRVASGDRTVDHRIGIYHAVEDDGNLLADIVAGHAGPDVGTFGIHAHRNGRLTVLSVLIDGAGIGHDTTVELGLSCLGSGLDGYELVDVVSCETLGRVDGPHCPELGREDLGDLRHLEILVDLGGVYCGSKAYAGITGLGRSQDSEERVGLPVGLQLLAGLLAGKFGIEKSVCDGLGCRRICCRLLDCHFFLTVCEDFGKFGIGLCEIDGDLLVGESLPELERCGSLEELSHTLRLLHTRELDEDASAVSEFLDRRLGHTETVDTVAEDIE